MQSEKKREGGAGSSRDQTPDYRSMDRQTLEQLAIAAIREHRVLLAADQEVYEEWHRASETPSMPSAVTQTLQAEYLVRQSRSEAQQLKLSDIIDALGYVPIVPEDNIGVASQ